jgi:hypothetical protein
MTGVRAEGPTGLPWAEKPITREQATPPFEQEFSCLSWCPLVGIQVPAKQGVYLQIRQILETQPAEVLVVPVRGERLLAEPRRFSGTKAAPLKVEQGFSASGDAPYELAVWVQKGSVHMTGEIYAASSGLKPEDAIKRAREERLRQTGFATVPKGTNPNCGPEHRTRIEIPLPDRDAFIAFLKNSLAKGFPDEGFRQWLTLGSFRHPDGQVDWEAAKKATRIEQAHGMTYYTLTFSPEGCSEFTLVMTSRGHASLYGCCGK